MAQEPIPLLQNIRVAAPCSASWDAMREVDGDRVKFCEHCQHKVYNLSEMGQAEAEGLLRGHEGRLCVRYYRRNDGTILTQDCPVGVRVARAAKKMLVRRFAAAAALVPCLWKAAAFLNRPAVVGDVPIPVKTEPMIGSPALPPVPTVEPVMGDVDIKPVQSEPVDERGRWTEGIVVAVHPREWEETPVFPRGYDRDPVKSLLQERETVIRARTPEDASAQDR